MAAQQRFSRLSAGRQHLHMQLRPGPQAAGEGRHALDRLDGAVSEEELGELRLLVSELLTNSVRHAAVESSWITLDVDIEADAVRVQVTDRGAGFERPNSPKPHADPPGGPGPGLATPLAERRGGDCTRHPPGWPIAGASTATARPPSGSSSPASRPRLRRSRPTRPGRRAG